MYKRILKIIIVLAGLALASGAVYFGGSLLLQMLRAHMGGG